MIKCNGWKCLFLRSNIAIHWCLPSFNEMYWLHKWRKGRVEKMVIMSVWQYKCQTLIPTTASSAMSHWYKESINLSGMSLAMWPRPHPTSRATGKNRDMSYTLSRMCEATWILGELFTDTSTVSNVYWYYVRLRSSNFWTCTCRKCG